MDLGVPACKQAWAEFRERPPPTSQSPSLRERTSLQRSFRKPWALCVFVSLSSLVANPHGDISDENVGCSLGSRKPGHGCWCRHRPCYGRNPRTCLRASAFSLWVWIWWSRLRYVKIHKSSLELILHFPQVSKVDVMLETIGTLAAGAQSSIGNVVAGSWFATMQSAATGGAGAAVVNGAIQFGGAMMTTAGGGLAWAKSKL